jgi:hypothetical protein
MTVRMQNQKHASRHHLARRPLSSQLLFYNVHTCTVPFRPAKAVPYLSRKFDQQQKISNQKMPPLLKFLTANNALVYGRQPRCRFESIPPSSTQMASRAASACHFPKNKPFLAETLKVELESLKARLRPVEHLDKEVEIEWRSSRTCD